MLKNTKGFTLVELIIVIVILSILSTIGFISYLGYTSSSRDAARITQLNEIYNGITTYVAKNKGITLKGKIDINSSGKTIGYQGYIGKNILSAIGYSDEGVDPKDGTSYSIYMTKNKKYFQLLAFLENPSDDIVSQEVNSRYVYVKGSHLGIMVDKDNNVIQEIPTIKTSGSIDISDVGDIVLKSYIKDSGDFITGSGNTFTPLKIFAQVGGQFCKSTNLNCNIVAKSELSLCSVEKGGLLNYSGSILCTNGGSNTYFNIVGLHYVWDCDNTEQKVECDAFNVCTFDDDNIGECVFG